MGRGRGATDRRHFDFDSQYGRDYEALAHRVIPGYATLFEMIGAIVDNDLPPGARVLVVGAGTGIELVTFKRLRPDLRVHGVDPSPQMLDIARRRVAEAGLGEGITYQLGYASDVDAAAPFDMATLINVLHFLPDDGGAGGGGSDGGGKAGLLADIAARVRPGGVFVLFDLHGEPGSEEHERYMPAWRRYWKVRGMGAEDREAFGERIRGGIQYASAERAVELARGAGFGEASRFYRSFTYGGWLFRRMGDGTPQEKDGRMNDEIARDGIDCRKADQ